MELPALLLALVLAPAQVTADHVPSAAASPPDEEVSSPMRLTIPLKRVPWGTAKREDTSTTREMARFVCDKARVARVMTTIRPTRKGMEVRIRPQLTTEWYRQDVHLTTALAWPDGEEIGSRKWRNLTIGDDSTSALPFAGRSKDPLFEVNLTREQLARANAGETPVLTLVLEVVGDD